MSKKTPENAWLKKHVGKPFLGPNGLEYKDVFETSELAKAECDRKKAECPDKQVMEVYVCYYTDDFDEGWTGPKHFHIGRPKIRRQVKSVDRAAAKLNKRIHAYVR